MVKNTHTTGQNLSRNARKRTLLGNIRKWIKSMKKPTYLKGLVFLIELHGITCVTISYVLAWQDKVSTNESLSATIVTEIVAPLITYAISKTVENIFEHNHLRFSEPIEEGDFNNGLDNQ